MTGSKARYDPFGTFTTATPGSNPSISSRGFTGHRHNNTGTNNLGLIYMNARYYMPEIGRFISPDTIVPDPANPQSYNRYAYSYNNPVNYTDSSGHCIDGLTTWACIAIGLKIVDYGWTAYDTWQAGRTLADPYASSEAKMMAGLTVGLAVIFEAIEPDDFLPVGLPADDVARRAIVSGAREALEEGGPEALEGFLREQLGDHADTALAKLDELLGIGDVRFLEKPGQLGHIFRNEAGHLAEDTLTNRNLLLGTVSGKNFVKADSFGNQWYARLLDDGTEAWVQVRNGIIQNGGVNLEPLYLH